MTEAQRVEKIGVAVLCRVSSKGGSGTYLYLPKIFTDTYSILPGNVAEIYIRRVFKKVWTEEEKPSKVLDLSKARPRRKKKKEKENE